MVTNESLQLSVSWHFRKRQGVGAGTHPALGSGDLCLQDVRVVLGGRGRPGVDCRRDEGTFRGGANTRLPVKRATKPWKRQSVELTARLRRGLVPPGIIQLLVLLLRQQEALLLHLVDLLLGAEGITGHRQVIA